MHLLKWLLIWNTFEIIWKKNWKYYFNIFKVSNICHLKIFSSHFTSPLNNKTLITNVLQMFLNIFNSLDQFKIYSHVPMIYYECYYMNKSKKFNINLNHHFNIWNMKYWLQLLIWYMLVWLHLITSFLYYYWLKNNVDLLS